MGKIMVSIICVTYNQSKYIADALESFLMQETKFSYEILVHDDHSDDGTDNIILSYYKNHPNLIVPVFEKENQYSKGVKIIDDIMVPMAKGKYIAICEGDDFWIDKNKLQKQFDAMEKHPDIDICSHGVITVDANSKEKNGQINFKSRDCVIPAEDVIESLGSSFGTCSLFFRKDVFYVNYDFYNYFAFDYSKQIKGSLRGGMLYLKDDMGAYRRSAEGSFTLLMRSNKQSYIHFFERNIKMLNLLNTETNFKYKKSIEIALLFKQFWIDDILGNFKSLVSKKYKVIRRRMTFRENIRIYIKFLFKPIIILRRKKRSIYDE